jgi:hypothetical protein
MKVTRALLDLLTGTIPPKCPILPVISTPGLTRAVLNLPAGKIKTRSVEGVILALENLYNSRISRNQQDSQEFLHLIHEALDTEDQNLKKRAGNETLVIPPNPFEGTLATQITCLRCAFTTPSKKEAFTELSLAVPSKWTCGLGECLNSVLTTDRIPDYACPSCTLENTLHVLELIPTKPAPPPPRHLPSPSSPKSTQGPTPCAPRYRRREITPECKVADGQSPCDKKDGFIGCAKGVGVAFGEIRL